MTKQPSDFEQLLKGVQKRVDFDNAIVEKRLAQMYRDSYKAANAELAKLFAKLGDDVSLPEARKYNRLDNMIREIADEYKSLTGKSIRLVTDTSAQNYTEAFYGYRWAMNQSLGIDLAWGILPVDAIRASVFSEYSGMNLIKTMRKNSAQELAKIQATITRGIATGQGYAKTAKQMEGNFISGYSDALRVVQTEAGRNYTEGHLAAHDEAVELGIDVVKIWDASLDGRTRPAHGALDGTEADEDGLFHSDLGGSGPGPGLMRNAADDVMCRCRATDSIRGMSQELRRIKGEGVVPYETYTSWATKLGWSRKTGWPKVRGL